MLRRTAQVVLVAATLVIAALATAVIISQTSWFKNWLRGVIVNQASRYLNGTLSIDRVGGNLFSGIELEGVSLEIDGRPVIDIKDARIEYSVLQLVSNNLVIRNIRLNEPVIHLRRGPAGWNLGTWSRPSGRKGTARVRRARSRLPASASATASWFSTRLSAHRASRFPRPSTGSIPASRSGTSPSTTPSTSLTCLSAASRRRSG